MTASESDDQTRVGNPERERAIALLNNALTDGYLDIHEFEERATVVYAARTRGELSEVLAHLPGNDRLFPHYPSPATSDVPAESAPMELDITWSTATRKGSWQVPARILVTGSMGTADLDFSHAEFSHLDVDIELQISASIVKLRLGEDHSLATDDLNCGSWSTVKDKAGPPTITTGPRLRLHGALSGWSNATIRRT